jgi:hypothetical protein
MLSKQDLRNAHSALGVLVVLLLVGGFLVRDAGEAAMQLVGVGAWIAGFCTLIFLNGRQDRRERREGKEPQ